MGAAQGAGGVGQAPILKIGGVAALLLAAGYVAIMPIFAAVGAPPGDAQARLDYHAGTVAAWWAIVALSVLTDLLFIPIAIALFSALRRWGESAMLLATAFTFLFVVLDLTVTWPAYVSLIGLGQEYATATVEQRATLVAAASYPSALLNSPLPAVHSILTLSIGILASGIVLLRAQFERAAALAGIATGMVGIASVPHTVLTGELSVLAVGASMLTIIWLVLVGRGLLRGR